MLRILLSCIVGTSLMTGYSYWKAKKIQEQFEEPEMLGKLVHRLAPETISPQSSTLAGWTMHYAIGGSFVLIYDQIWKNTSLKPGVISGLLLGAPSGLIGMLAWATMLKTHPDPPRTHLKKHLKQLFFAHIIFGISSAMTYQLLEKTNNRSGKSSVPRIN